MPNQNDSPPVLSGTVPAQPDYTLCKNIADLKITNSSGYEGLCVNFNTDDAVQTVFVIEANRVDFDPDIIQSSHCMPPSVDFPMPIYLSLQQLYNRPLQDLP
jgi:hypothetical protein